MYIAHVYKGEIDCDWNVMAHARKPDFVFRRNGRVHLKRQGSQFNRLLAAEVCASAVVTLDTPCSEVVWRVLATHSVSQLPLRFPSRASPCAITFQLESKPLPQSTALSDARTGTVCHYVAGIKRLLCVDCYFWIFVVWMSGDWSEGTMSKPWKYIFVHGKKQSFPVPRSKHLSAKVKGIQSSLFSFVIADYHLVDTNWEATTELFSLCISHLQRTHYCLPWHVPARCVYSMVRGQMQSNKTFIYW